MPHFNVLDVCHVNCFINCMILCFLAKHIKNDYIWKHFGNKIKCQPIITANVAYLIIEIYVFIFSV